MSDTTSTTAGHEPAARPDTGHDSHDDAGGHGAHGGHPEPAGLGPIDWRAWGAGLVGVAAGAAVAVSLYLATAPR